MTDNWPVAELDAVRRLRVLAAATRGAMYAEQVIDVSFHDAWTVAVDLEHEFPKLLPDVRSLHVIHTEGERLEAQARGRLGQRARFRIVMRPGWCWMQSRFLVGGIAAVAEGESTRVAFMGALRLPGARALRPLLNRTNPATAVITRLETRARSRRST
ncbi:hypothetical protein ACGFNU_39415 [Spirillospora sp. NPDC048911]|uniref:hypothetical protein n=1 Tax=Spirillospora sp. NPDC048911 TaxID=3364527 RepID=UPI003717C855